MRPAALFLAMFLTTLSPTGAAEPLDDAVVGPMQVCFKYSSFLLGEDERITDFEGGAEGMAVTIEGPHGSYRVAESEILAARLGRLVLDREGTRVHRLRQRERGYAIRGPTSFSPDEDRTVLLLEGDALTGAARDALIYRRFRVGDPSGLNCPWQFTYSW